jgi:hypothetical protein
MAYVIFAAISALLIGCLIRFASRRADPRFSEWEEDWGTIRQMSEAAKQAVKVGNYSAAKAIYTDIVEFGNLRGRRITGALQRLGELYQGSGELHASLDCFRKLRDSLQLDAEKWNKVPQISNQAKRNLRKIEKKIAAIEMAMQCSRDI